MLFLALLECSERSVSCQFQCLSIEKYDSLEVEMENVVVVSTHFGALWR